MPDHVSAGRASDSLPPGARLGTYLILRTLGAGGMGVVYLAQDTKLGREVAIKVLPETADRSLIARVSEDKKHLVAMAWDETDSQLMTNTMIPCLHAGPIRSVSVQPGEVAVWRGSIYLMGNDPTALLVRHEQDEKSKFMARK